MWKSRLFECWTTSILGLLVTVAFNADAALGRNITVDQHAAAAAGTASVIRARWHRRWRSMRRMTGPFPLLTATASAGRRWALLQTFDIVENDLSTAACRRYNVALEQARFYFAISVGCLRYQTVLGRFRIGNVPSIRQLGDGLAVAVVGLQNGTEWNWIRCPMFEPTFARGSGSSMSDIGDGNPLNMEKC